MLNGCPYRVFPHLIAVGIQILIDGHIWLFNLGIGSTLEVHVQILRKVPTQIELTVPQELRRKRERQVLILSSLHVALLQFVVVARYLGIEAYVLRQPV